MKNKQFSLSTVAILVVAGGLYLAFGPKTPPASTTAENPKTTAKDAGGGATGSPSSGKTTAAAPTATSGTPTSSASAGGTSGTQKRDDSAVIFGIREAKAKPAGTIRLATYNIENLYDNRADGKSKVTDEKPAAHKAAAAQAIRAIDADVLALEEIESKEALTEFRDQYLKDMGYTFVSSIDAGDGRGIEQSVLSRFPLSGEKNWLHAKLEGVHLIDNPKEHIKAGEPLDLKRSPLHVVVSVPGDKTGGKPYEFTLFVMHHKAGKEFGYWRTAEASFITKLVKEEQKAGGGRVAVLGDFNAPPQDESVQVYVTGGLVDAFKDRTKEPKWITHQSGRSIDYIMMTSNFQADVVTETRFILGMPLKPQRGNWDTMPYPVGYGSDHLPVVVDIKVK